MPARTKRISIDENTRAKIQASQLINRLTDHILGKIDLNATQVTAALGLLKKTLPDLSAVDLQANITLRPKLIDLSGGKLTKALDNEPTDTDS